LCYAPPAVNVNAVTVTCCPDAMDVLSISISPPPPVAVTVPCIWQTVPPESMISKCAAVPVASALASCHVPDLAFVPPDAAAIQSLGRFSVASTVPVREAAQLAGAPPVRMRRIADVPVVDSIASRAAFLALVENWNAML